VYIVWDSLSSPPEADRKPRKYRTQVKGEFLLLVTFVVLAVLVVVRFLH